MTRRHLLASASAGLTAASAAASPAAASTLQATVQKLLDDSEAGNAALMRGDIDRYLALVPLAPDFVLMSPFGGKPGRSTEYTPQRLEAIGRFFRNGTFRQEVVQTYATADMVVLAVIERANVEVGELPAQDWALRVTLVYRRKAGDAWELVHRHADPLAGGISVAQSAALARQQNANF